MSELHEFERDTIIDKVRDTLRSAPHVAPDQRAVARVLSSVWESPPPSGWRRLFNTWRVPALSGLGAGVLAVGALLVGFVTRGVVPSKQHGETLVAEGAPTGEFPVQNVTYDAALVQTQFVFEHGEAERIALVGDFNDWKGEATPLTRMPNGLWTTTVALPPGRHVYSYLIDGTLLVADPRAPKSGDADYGNEGSVVMVFAR